MISVAHKEKTWRIIAWISGLLSLAVLVLVAGGLFLIPPAPGHEKLYTLLAFLGIAGILFVFSMKCFERSE